MNRIYFFYLQLKICIFTDFFICGLSYSYHGNFSISYKKMNQTEAKLACEFYCPSNRLADITSTEEEQRYRKHFQCLGFEQSWFGLEKINNEWLWYKDGTPGWSLHSDTQLGRKWQHWARNEPDNGQPCVRIRFTEGLGANRNCSKEYGYICEGDFPDPCATNPCMNEGTCCVIDFDYFCSCKTNFYGKRCESNVQLSRCSNPPIANNTDIVYDPGSYEVNEVVVYVCKHGYEHTGGHLVRRCTTSSIWSGCAPTCDIINCTVPYIPPNVKSISSPENYNVNTMVQYQCVLGYELASGDLVRMCQEDKTWNGDTPICHVIKCDDPGTIDHASFSSGPYIYLITLVFTCDAGYTKVSGQLKVRCMSNKQWSAEFPVCKKVPCPAPAPSIGVVTQNSSSELREICESGYEMMSGDKHRTCLPGGTWSGSKVVCQAISCEEPPLERDTHISMTQIGDPFKYQSILNFTCDEGYTLASGQLLVVCLADSKWSGQFPLCEAMQDILTCKTPSDGVGLISVSNGTAYMSVLRQSCEPEYYRESGDNNMTCTENGTWSGKPLLCKVIQCDNPGSISHTKYTQLGNNFTIQSVLNFTCDRGYHLTSGQLIVVCLESGQWSGNFPTCTATMCPTPDIKDGVRSIYNGTTYMSVLDDDCNHGYYKEWGDNHRTCLENGTWSGHSIICKVERCPNPSTFANAEVTVKKSSASEVAAYRCKYGYELLVDPSNKICLSNLTWNGEDPVCKFAPKELTIYVTQKTESAEANSTKDKFMKQLGMLEVDFLPFNITLGSIIGSVYLTVTLGLFICLDFVSIQKDIKRLKRNLNFDA